MYPLIWVNVNALKNMPQIVNHQHTFNKICNLKLIWALYDPNQIKLTLLSKWLSLIWVIGLKWMNLTCLHVKMTWPESQYFVTHNNALQISHTTWLIYAASDGGYQVESQGYVFK